MPSANTSTVAAIVVTYNRLEKLKNVLASLEAQTRLPEHLVIVNNASTDDTAAYLAEYERDFTLKDKVRITIVTLTENAGGAGGFSAGMRKGYELGADFVWIFDDDGYPQPAALAKLLEGYDNAVAGLGTDVPYVCSMVKFIDGSISEMNNPIPTWDWGRLQAMGYDNLVIGHLLLVRVCTHPALGDGGVRPAVQGVLHLVRRRRIHAAHHTVVPRRGSD